MRYPSLGPRGEGWVVAQFSLGAVIVLAGLGGARWPDPVRVPLIVTGVLVGVRGLVLLAQGVLALGTSLTPFPHPSERAVLREQGVYARVRHPIYGGVLLLALGWSLALSPLALLSTALLWGLLEAKSRHEEALLRRRYPGYADYAERVPRRLLPHPF